MGILKRKSIATGRKAAVDVQKRGMPPVSRTLGHNGSIAFSKAILDEQWGDAEKIFASCSLVDQAHMISVSSNVGGPADDLNDWVHQDLGSGVAELARGAKAIVNAWDVRTGASAEAMDSSVIDNFHVMLKGAEDNLSTAADKMPKSSIPWQHLLTSGRGLHVGRVEMDERYVRHIECGELLAGHMSFQQLITKKWAGSHEEMWEHAEWILKTAAPGSPHHAVVAIALIENHIKPETKYDSVRQLPSLIGKTGVLAEAAHSSYADPNFDASTPEGATSLSAWFTLHYLMGNWELAADLVPLIGDRFTSFPMAYFQDASWLEVQEFVCKRLVTAA